MTQMAVFNITFNNFNNDYDKMIIKENLYDTCISSLIYILSKIIKKCVYIIKLIDCNNDAIDRWFYNDLVSTYFDDYPNINVTYVLLYDFNMDITVTHIFHMIKNIHIKVNEVDEENKEIRFRFNEGVYNNISLSTNISDILKNYIPKIISNNTYLDRIIEQTNKFKSLSNEELITLINTSTSCYIHNFDDTLDFITYKEGNLYNFDIDGNIYVFTDILI